MHKGKVLLADSDLSFLEDIRSCLVSTGYEVCIANDQKRVLEACSESTVDVAIIAADIAVSSCANLIERIRQIAPYTSIVTMENFEAEESSCANGHENLVKPFSHRELKLILKLIFDNKKLAAENAVLSKRKMLREEVLLISGKGKHAEELAASMERAADNKLPVTIIGEEGTCKETVARIIHSNNFNNYGPFVAITCSHFTEESLMAELFGGMERGITDTRRANKGKVELADAGTLYIRDIERVPSSVQIRLIHLIEEKGFEEPGTGCWMPVQVRLMVGVSSKRVITETDNGVRPDLCCRLNANRVFVPSLKQIRDSLPLVINERIRITIGEGHPFPTISEDVMRVLCSYEWAGNHTELDSCILYLLSHAANGEISLNHLPSEMFDATELTEMISSALEEVEKRHIAAVLNKCAWNKHQAARELEISKSTLYGKISKYRLNDRRVNSAKTGSEKKCIQTV